MASWKQINFTQIARDFWKFQINKLGSNRLHEMDCQIGWNFNADELKKFFQQYKLEYINHGRSRATCVVDGKWVVKFPIGLFGLESNQKEVEAFQKIPADRRQFFTRVLQRGLKFEYLLVERVIPNNDRRANIPNNVLRQITDAAHFNFGQRINGEWVVLDYAEEI